MYAFDPATACASSMSSRSNSGHPRLARVWIDAICTGRSRPRVLSACSTPASMPERRKRRHACPTSSTRFATNSTRFDFSRARRAKSIAHLGLAAAGRGCRAARGARPCAARPRISSTTSVWYGRSATPARHGAALLSSRRLLFPSWLGIGSITVPMTVRVASTPGLSAHSCDPSRASMRGVAPMRGFASTPAVGVAPMRGVASCEGSRLRRPSIGRD